MTRPVRDAESRPWTAEQRAIIERLLVRPAVETPRRGPTTAWWRPTAERALQIAQEEAMRALRQTGRRHAVIVTTALSVKPKGVVFAVVPSDDRRAAPFTHVIEVPAPKLAGYTLHTTPAGGDIDPTAWTDIGTTSDSLDPRVGRARSVHGRPR